MLAATICHGTAPPTTAPPTFNNVLHAWNWWAGGLQLGLQGSQVDLGEAAVEDEGANICLVGDGAVHHE
jgi:hypothetical protein